ncbi:MAG TPA: hypothetical protein VK638_41455 [Edaphobacter sp.]|nr:hypothetical protein [Edaphobacter sp.]
MPIPEDEMIVSTTDYFVTEANLNPKATLDEVQAFVKRSGTSGTITVTANGGGQRRVFVVEKTECDDLQSNSIRQILGMDYEVEVDDDGLEGK